MAHWRADKFATVEDTDASASSVGTVRVHLNPFAYLAIDMIIDKLVSSTSYNSVTTTVDSANETIIFATSGCTVLTFTINHSGLNWVLT